MFWLVGGLLTATCNYKNEKRKQTLRSDSEQVEVNNPPSTNHPHPFLTLSPSMPFVVLSSLSFVSSSQALKDRMEEFETQYDTVMKDKAFSASSSSAKLGNNNNNHHNDTAAWIL